MKIEAKSRLSASTMLECGCVSAKVCAHSVSALTEKQKKLDINKNGKIDADDLKKVREGELSEATTTRLSGSTLVSAAKSAQVKFKDGSTHKVLFFSDPNKRKGTFILRSKDLPGLKFIMESGKYVVYTVGSQRNDIDKESRFDTKTSEAAEAYMKGIKKFWKAV